VLKLKNIFVLLLVAVMMLVGCGQKTEEEFVSIANDFYVKMMIDGEQSEDVNELYNELVTEYEEYNNDELHKELINMYKAIGDKNEAATKYQTNVMKILNER
jgi:hypothetical protein